MSPFPAPPSVHAWTRHQPLQSRQSSRAHRPNRYTQCHAFLACAIETRGQGRRLDQTSRIAASSASYRRTGRRAERGSRSIRGIHPEAAIEPAGARAVRKPVRTPHGPITVERIDTLRNRRVQAKRCNAEDDRREKCKQHHHRSGTAYDNRLRTMHRLRRELVAQSCFGHR